MSKKPIRAVILVRDSDQETETLRLVRKLKKIARQRGWKVVEVCEEPSRGTDQRTGLNRVKELVETGTVTKVMVDEVSRIGRRNSEALEFLQFLEHHKVSLYWHAQEMDTLQANGKRSSKAALMFALLVEMARAERESRAERTKAGLAAARAQGRIGGRPKGLSAEAKRNAAAAAALYRKGTLTISEICDKRQISRSTLYNYLRHEGVRIGQTKRTSKRAARKSTD